MDFKIERLEQNEGLWRKKGDLTFALHDYTSRKHPLGGGPTLAYERIASITLKESAVGGVLLAVAIPIAQALLG